jgi:hypothetical protein
VVLVTVRYRDGRRVEAIGPDPPPEASPLTLLRFLQDNWEDVSWVAIQDLAEDFVIPIFSQN